MKTYHRKRADLLHLSCPSCQKKLWGCELFTMNQAPTGEPVPGDVGLCVRCGAVFEFRSPSRLREMFESEIERFDAEHGQAFSSLQAFTRRVLAIEGMR